MTSAVPRILTVDDVAALLRCEPATVRERTPHDLPGFKFGRDWVYSELVIHDALVTLSTRKNAPAAANHELPPPLRRKRSRPLPELIRQLRAA